MPGVGLEPTSSCERRLLRPLPLPIWAPGPLWGSYSQRPRSCRARGVDWRRSARTGRGRRLGAAAASRRGRGGIGRHAGLRSRWAKALGGSSPSARISKKYLHISPFDSATPNGSRSRKGACPKNMSPRRLPWAAACERVAARTADRNAGPASWAYRHLPGPALSQVGEAVAQTPAVRISYQDLTSAIRRFESNHASRVVDGSQEPSDDVGPELIDARLCALYNAPPLCDSLA